jgi:short subunit dehydrogenase-like uncharacterized protein
MTGRIVLYGATGYTGRLTAAALVHRGLRPVLAGRAGPRLAQLADKLGGLETAVADAGDPPSVRSVLDRGDVLVTTVGPFIRLGAAAVQAACDAGAVYLDSTGEPPFIREVFAEHGPRAEANGAALLTAFGYDYVPGNLAGALALSRAGAAAVRVEIGYFVHGGGIIGAASGGTTASALGVLFTQSHRFSGGQLGIERAAKHVRTFRLDGAARQGVSLGGSEHLALPGFAPQLREVGVYLGWPGGQVRLAQAGLGCWAAMRHLPGSERVVTAGLRQFGPSGSTGGPDEAARARTSAVVIAQAFDAAGALLTDVALRCGNPYDFTAEVLAWGAGCAAEGGILGAGALGPVSAFGLPALVAGCAQAGLVEDATT